MTYNKKNSFEAPLVRIAEYARILSHPARIAILKELSTRKSCICGEIVDVLPLAQSTVSQHLKELNEAGIIKGTIEGTKSCYCIDIQKLKQLNAEMNMLLKSLEVNNEISDCC